MANRKLSIGCVLLMGGALTHGGCSVGTPLDVEHGGNEHGGSTGGGAGPYVGMAGEGGWPFGGENQGGAPAAGDPGWGGDGDHAGAGG